MWRKMTMRFTCGQGKEGLDKKKKVFDLKQTKKSSCVKIKVHKTDYLYVIKRFMIEKFIK